jgi:tetratricopeptide (TPR) repeat protein
VNDERATAEGRADLAAILITKATRLPSDDVTKPEMLAEAGVLLSDANSYFRDAGDRGWINRTENNMISLAVLRGEPEHALELLTSARDATNEAEGRERVEFDRRGLSLAVSELSEPDAAAAFARDAAEVVAAGRASASEQALGSVGTEVLTASAARAWQLALGGAFLRDYVLAQPQAIDLFQEARAIVETDDTLWFHITNDLGSTLEDSGDSTSALECFDSCLDLANRRDDRYMRQMALANRGEMLRRGGDPAEAQHQSREAAELAHSLLDFDAEVGSLLNLTWAYIDTGDYGSAERSLVETSTVAADRQIESSTSRRFASARAGLAAARGDYEQSYRWHLRSAADADEPVERVESLIAALQDLARSGNHASFRRLLNRLERLAQQSELDGHLSELLAPIGGEWIVQNAARLAARTFADAILLGVSAALKLSRLGNGDGDADALLYPIVTPIVQMNLAIARGSVSRSRVVRDVFRRIRRALPVSRRGIRCCNYRRGSERIMEHTGC